MQIGSDVTALQTALYQGSSITVKLRCLNLKLGQIGHMKYLVSRQFMIFPLTMTIGL